MKNIIAWMCRNKLGCRRHKMFESPEFSQDKCLIVFSVKWSRNSQIFRKLGANLQYKKNISFWSGGRGHNQIADALSLCSKTTTLNFNSQISNFCKGETKYITLQIESKTEVKIYMKNRWKFLKGGKYIACIIKIYEFP